MPNNCRIACVSLSEQPVAWSRTANALTGVAVRSRSQHSRFAVSNVSLSSSGDSMNNSNHELLTSQTGLIRQCPQDQYSTNQTFHRSIFLRTLPLQPEYALNLL